MAESSFWYVFKVNGGAPSYKHPTYQSALLEAERLASRLGGEYLILKAEAVVKPAPRTITVPLVDTNGYQVRYTYVNASGEETDPIPF